MKENQIRAKFLSLLKRNDLTTLELQAVKVEIREYKRKNPYWREQLIIN